MSHLSVKSIIPATADNGLLVDHDATERVVFTEALRACELLVPVSNLHHARVD